MSKWKWHFILGRIFVVFVERKGHFVLNIYIIQYYCMWPDWPQYMNLWVIEKNLCGPLRFVFEYPWHRFIRSTKKQNTKIVSIPFNENHSVGFINHFSWLKESFTIIKPPWIKNIRGGVPTDLVCSSSILVNSFKEVSLVRVVYEESGLQGNFLPQEVATVTPKLKIIQKGFLGLFFSCFVRLARDYLRDAENIWHWSLLMLFTWAKSGQTMNEYLLINIFGC